MVNLERKRMTVIGAGYIGLPTAAMFAKSGLIVSVYDNNKKVIENLRNDNIVLEDGLEEILSDVLGSSQLVAENHVSEADIYIIATPTPINSDLTPDLSAVKDASYAIAKLLKKGNVVILESTSPPKTTEDVVKPILEEGGLIAGEDFYLAYSPERVIPGKILYEIVNNHRVIGGINKKSSEIVKEIYSSFVKGEIYITDSRTAELCKLMENTYRDVNIALANEAAKICADLNLNVWELITLSNKHPRVNLLQPGPGVGGHCIAVDPWFIVEASENAKLIKESREINDSMPEYTRKMIEKILPNGGKVTILGFAYKPDADDFRESPVLKFAELVNNDDKYDVVLHDPYYEIKPIDLDIKVETNFENAISQASLLIMGVNHSKYKSLDFFEISKLMKNKIIFDTRNFIDREIVEGLGFEYHLLGRG